MAVNRTSFYAGIGGRASARRGLPSAASATADHNERSWLISAARLANVDLEEIVFEAWLALGESYSKCAHFIHSPLRPEWFEALTREQVGEAAAALFHLEDVDPATQDDTTAELVRELRELDRERVHRRSLGLTAQGLNTLNTRLHPGAVEMSEPTWQVLCNICDRLNGPAFQHGEPLLNFALAFVRATLAHFELLRARPFGAQSAATARVVEFGLLLEIDEISIRQAGLLSIHYASTRGTYQQFRIDPGVRAVDFVNYAAVGFRRALREQMHDSRLFLPRGRLQLFRENFVRSRLNGTDPATVRRVGVALADSQLRTPADLDPTTISDLALLEQASVIRRAGDGYVRAWDPADGQ